jgi:hypothetical protein
MWGAVHQNYTPGKRGWGSSGKATKAASGRYPGMPPKLPEVPTTTPLSPEHDYDWWFDPELAQLYKKTRDKSDLSAEEVLLLALTAGQAALARYIEPGDRNAEETINKIMDALDHQTVVAVTRAKARELLARREGHIADIPSLTDVLAALYQSEINASVCVSSFWDGGWQWKIQLGDEMNGFMAEETFTQEQFQSQAAAWLIEAATKAYPDSQFTKQYAARLLPVD